ncbi:putative disease resistance RPP13-like protein 1 [Bienertia sinuspersici]
MGLRFPTWLGDPSFNNMVKISLTSCSRCEWLPPLGQLPKLENLWIRFMVGIKEVGPEFYGDLSKPFSALKSLQFSFLIGWEKWVHTPDNHRAMPLLERLKIRDYRKLPKSHIITKGVASPNFRTASHQELQKSAKSTASDAQMHLPQTIGYLFVPKSHIITKGAASPNFRMAFPQQCPKLECFRTGGLPINLKEARINNKAGDEEKWGLHHLRSLEKLALIQVDSEEMHNLLLLSSLYSIHIEGIPNLKDVSVDDGTYFIELWVVDCPNLESLVCNFLSFTNLYLDNCPKLQSLPQSLSLPSHLHDLRMEDLGRCTDAVENILCTKLDLPYSLVIYG